ncbi:MAG: GtrA family protein [Actinobacteria bacterium]|nr:MAG: GtrA family protein [Actinomycetota bacterium]
MARLADGHGAAGRRSRPGSARARVPRPPPAPQLGPAGEVLRRYAALLNGANLHYTLAATGSFVVAVTNNYLWNRLWTFRHSRGHFAFQGLRFFLVALIAYAGNLAILTVLVEVGLGKIVSQAIAIVLVTPANFVGNKLWSFRRQH